MTRRKRRIRNEVCLRDLRKGVFKNRISAERETKNVLSQKQRTKSGLEVFKTAYSGLDATFRLHGLWKGHNEAILFLAKRKRFSQIQS